MSAEPAPLVIRFGSFGDMVLMIPVVRLLAARYGRPCDLVSSGSWTDPLFRRVPEVGERFYLTSRRAPYWFNRSQRELVSWLRRRGPGPVYVFELDEKPRWLLRRAGIEERWICSLPDFPLVPGEHILAPSLRLAQSVPAALGQRAPSADRLPSFSTRPVLSDEDRHDCAAWLTRRNLADRPLVLIQAGNKKTNKRGDRRRATNVKHWPESNWATVISFVRESLPAAAVILCGAPMERPLAEEIFALLPSGVREQVVIATDELPIARLLALQERAHSLISVDTGPAHSAAAMGCPLVVLFTRLADRTSDLYAPIATTAPVRIVQPDASIPDAVIANIPPQDVIVAWRGLVGL